MSAVLERCIAAKRSAQIAPVTPPHWRREIQGDAGRYDGAFSYALPGAAKTLEIAETAASTGTKVWDCAVALARMFEYNTNKTASPLAIRASERVLELGGGSGLLALALAALGADVTTTDAAPVVPHLRKTIDANAGSVPRTPTVAALDWRDADHTTMGAFPVVVASDVLVCVQWAEDVARVLAAVAAEARLVVVATQRRRDGVARFLEAAAAHFTVEELREDSFHPDYYHHDLQVLVLTPR